MNGSTQNITYYIRYKDIVKERARANYAKNKDKIKEKQREKYKQMSENERKAVVLIQKEWFDRETDKKKKDEVKLKKREYSKNRNYNHIIEVK